jgi:hypothetical protein
VFNRCGRTGEERRGLGRLGAGGVRSDTGCGLFGFGGVCNVGFSFLGLGGVSSLFCADIKKGAIWRGGR